MFALVPILWRHGPAAQLYRVNFSAKEKDEASPPDCFPLELEEAFIPALPEFEGFLILGRPWLSPMLSKWLSNSALVSPFQTYSAPIGGAERKTSVYAP